MTDSRGTILVVGPIAGGHCRLEAMMHVVGEGFEEFLSLPLAYCDPGDRNYMNKRVLSLANAVGLCIEKCMTWCETFKCRVWRRD